MRYKIAFLLCLIAFPVFAFVSLKPSPKPTFKSSIIGKWRVTSDDPHDIKNHTYEFLNDSICIEKYRSWELGGPIDEPPNDVEVDTVTTYRYKVLAGKRLRFYPIRSVSGPQIDQSVPTWHILEVTITKNQAVVYQVDRQQLEIEKEMLKSVENNSQQKKMELAAIKKSMQTWVRIPSM